MTQQSIGQETESGAAILNGKVLSERLRGRISQVVTDLINTKGFAPGLAVVIVGDDPASQIYVRNKVKQTKAMGMRSFESHLPDHTPQHALLSHVHALNLNPDVHGILVQLPLPDHIDAEAVISMIAPEKDVDGFHHLNAGHLMTGRPSFVPCTPLGCMMLIKQARPDLTGLEAVVIGRSNIVGKPLAHLLLAEHCTVTMAHSRTKDLAAVARRADVLVAAVGQPELVKGDWIKPGATVIDVGINRIPTPDGKTKLVGDVAFDEAVQVAGAITPVPKGVGPMTIACLLRNTVQAACEIEKVEIPDLTPVAEGA